MIPPSEAIAQLVWALQWAGGDLPVLVDRQPEMRLRPPDVASRLYRRARDLDFKRNAEVAVRLPERGGLVTASTVLWAWIVGGESERRAHRFRPAPSIVLRIGRSSERLLLWTLAEPAPANVLEGWNGKLSYALHGARTRSRAEQLAVPLPGTFQRIGRIKPAAILCTRLELAEHDPLALVGRLKDPPPPDAWKDRK